MNLNTILRKKEEQQHMENIASITNDQLLSSSVVQKYSAKQRQLLRMQRNRKKYHDEQLQPLINQRTLSSSQIYNTNGTHISNVNKDNNNIGTKSNQSRSKAGLLFKSKSLVTVNSDNDKNDKKHKKYNDDNYLLITTHVNEPDDNTSKNIMNKTKNNNSKSIKSILSDDETNEIIDYNHGQICDNNNDTIETLEAFFDKSNNNNNDNKTSEKT